MMIEIMIKGVIVGDDDKWVYDWFGIKAVCPKDVLSKLEEAKGKAVEVVINSGGGDAFAGSEIYTSLKDYKGDVTIKIVGIAASAASVIAMAGNTVKISPTAQIMIHNVWKCAGGDYRTFQHEAEVLENYNKSIANAYILKTGMSQEKLLKLMNDETWLNAQQAKEKGFVDEVMFDKEKKIAANFNRSALLPSEVINKIRNQVQKNDNVNNDIYRAKLKLLKIKGEKINE